MFPDNRAKLYETLHEIETLARNIGCDNWAKWFLSAQKVMDGEETEQHYEYDFHGLLTDERLHLFKSLTWAWVFGGMGSWNDSPPYMAQEKGLADEYDRLTPQLYENVLKALMYCVNA